MKKILLPTVGLILGGLLIFATDDRVLVEKPKTMLAITSSGITEVTIVVGRTLK